jgi:DNA polymerase-3 subunit alpha
MSNFFHAHCHSNYSPLDAMSEVKELVRKAVMNKQPALALTDHGLMSGIVKLYKECKAAGIKPFPGIETYLIDPEMDDWETPPKGAKVKRYHVGLLALDEEGYKALVKFSSMTHTRPRFSRFARCTIADLYTLGKQHGEHLALTTGCYFGLVQQRLVNNGPEAARKAIEFYATAFPHTFVELQHHNITHDDGKTDDWIVEQLVEIADDLGLPVIATQDAHYCDQPQKQAHQLMKRMSYGSAEDEFPGDSFHLASTEWVSEHYTDEQWELIEDGMSDLLSLNNVSIGPLDNYKIDLPKIKGVGDPLDYIDEVASDRLDELEQKNPFVKAQLDDYEGRLGYELSVIEKLGMAPYFVIWVLFVQWCRSNGIAIEARGSANGSLVCYLLGITQADPIKWGTMFERFLSPDRTKPPDVDMDIEDLERPYAINHLLYQYDAVQIGTFGRLGITVNDDGEETGSIMVTWKAWKRTECTAIATTRWEQGKLEKKGDIERYAQGIFQKKYAGVNEVDDVKNISHWEWRGLRQIDQMGTVYKSYGVHAGGVLLSGEHVKIEDWIPTMLVASSDTRVTQYDMHDVEEFGLLKMDVLGQATLRSMKLANALIDPKNDPTDFDWIEDDDLVACSLLREGRLNTGIFHYEGWTKSKGGKELGIKTTMDAILGQALYMPGCMDVAPGMTVSQKDLYISRRKSVARRKSVRYLHPAFEDALQTTYGAVVFQEQVIQIMRNLGMDIAGINKFFAVVKDSGRGSHERNVERMREVRQQFDSLCRKAKIDPDEAWKQTASFVSYGFNRAHATGYGIRSYRTAYMKAHHPLEFMTGLLQTWAGRKKEPLYISEARRIGIRILPPDVQVSGPTWTIDPNYNQAIRKGLVTISGIGVPTAEQIASAAPFESVQDMVGRLPARAMSGGKKYLETGIPSGIIGKLLDAGALESLLHA